MPPRLVLVKPVTVPPTVIYNDPIFFHKSQVRLGVQIEYFGRRDPGARWRVIEISSHEYVKGNVYKEVTVEEVKYLTDRVTIARVGKPGLTRNVSFANISYSAIWRLVG